MGKDNSSPKIPKAPDPTKYYQKFTNLYLNNLPRFLGAEQGYRDLYDPTRILEQQALQQQFGPTQYAQMLAALKQIDPSGYALREQTAGGISGNLKQLQGDLAQGTKLTPDQEQQLEQEIRRSQAARGNVYGQAPVQAEAFTKGQAGLNLYQQRLQNYNQGLGTALNFQNSATPESWAQAIPPVAADRSMAYVNPNAGFQGVQYGLQNYQNQLAATQLGNQNSGYNPWMSAIGLGLNVLGSIPW